MNAKDTGPALAGQPPRWDGRLFYTEDGRPLDAAGGILAGIGLSLPAWIAAAAVLHGLP
jgi:hypothetical protein